MAPFLKVAHVGLVHLQFGGQFGLGPAELFRRERTRSPKVTCKSLGMPTLMS